MRFQISTAVLGLALVSSSAMAANNSFISSAPPAPGSYGDVVAAPMGTKGISFAFPAGGGGTVGVAYFLAPNRAVRADVGLDLGKKDPASTTFGFSVDAGYRMYCAKSGGLAAFMQPSFFISRASASSAPVTLGPSASVGAEYFFNSNLAFGVNTGLNLTFTDSFKSFRINTGTTALTGTFYW